MTPERQVLEVDGRAVRVTHLDKVLYPATGTTKAEVIDYVVRAAPALLPQLRDRPVTRIRWPHGVDGERFFEKNTPRGAPDWLRHLDLPASPGDEDGTRLDLPFLDDLASLVWAANSGALELHTPQWSVTRRGRVRPPDRLVIDLDPGPPAGLDECAQVAHVVADRLRADGFASVVPVTSGSKGMQLYAPLPSDGSVGDVREYARSLARTLAAGSPLVVAVMRKDLRGGKVLLDWSQNHLAKTTITPYSLRGRERPSVAAPRWWDEIGPGLRQLTPDEVLSRLATRGDPFASGGT